MSGMPDAAARPRWTGTVVFALFLVVDTAAQLSFKWAGDAAGAGAFDGGWVAGALALPQVWIAAFFYVALFVVWMVVLQLFDLSHAFPLSGLAYVTVPAASWALFGDDITLLRAAGIGLIVFGVFLIGGRE